MAISPNYVPFEVTIDDLNPSQNPGSIIIAFYSSYTNQSADASLLVDDISLDFPTSITETNTYEEYIDVNPTATDRINIVSTHPKELLNKLSC